MIIKPLTLEEFWQLSDPPDRSKQELIKGVLYVTKLSDESHDYIVSNINYEISSHFYKTKTDGSIYAPRAAIWAEPNTHLEPDLFFLSIVLKRKLKGKSRSTADLVVEIISPGSAIYDRNTKADTYGALGVHELWLVDETSKTVEVRYQTGDGFGRRRTFRSKQSIISKVFPELKLRVSDIFAG